MAVNQKGGTPLPPNPQNPPQTVKAVAAPAQSIAQPKGGELVAAMSIIKKQLGEKSIVYGNQIPNPERLPTGVFEFDLATGGGFPKNRYSIVYGPESSGKTNLVYKAIASAQRLPPPCNKAVFVDLEGCVAFDSRFMDMTSGQVYTAEEVFVEKLPLAVRSFNYEEGRVQIEPLSAWFDNGVKPVYEIETSSAAVRATDNHRFWVCQTLDSAPEWVRADAIEEGWYLASPNADKDWEWPTVHQITPTDARFIGMMLGDGCMVGGGSPTFANIDPDVVADMRGIVESWGGTLTTYSDRHHRLSGLGKASKWHPATATTLLKKVGIWGSKGSDKFIPEAVFESGKDVALQCLAGLYLTDGTVSTVRPTLALSNTSLTLMEQVRELWRRLGVPSSLHKTKMYQEHHAQQYILSINTTAMLKVVQLVIRCDQLAIDGIAQVR